MRNYYVPDIKSGARHTAISKVDIMSIPIRIAILMKCTEVNRLFICERHFQEFGNIQLMELYIAVLLIQFQKNKRNNISAFFSF